MTSVLGTPRSGQSSSVLADESHLLISGENDTGVLSLAETFNPASGLFSEINDILRIPRTHHTATVLIDGRVLLTGGSGGAGGLDSAEHFDAQSALIFKPPFNPADGRFTLLSNLLTTPRWNHTATLLPSGEIVIVGGENDTGPLGSAEVFNPVTETSSPLTGTMLSPRSGHSATLLPDGRILILGGRNLTGFLASAEIFDPGSGIFSSASPDLALPRADHTATLLSFGEILITGGENAGGVLNTTDLYGPLPQDTTAPTVVSVLPPDSANDIDLTEVIGIRFSEPVDVTTLNAVNVSLEGGTTPPNVTISPSENGLLVFVHPETGLAAGTPYTLILSPGITDTSGNPLSSHTRTFTTFKAPVITAVTPDHAPPGESVTITGQHFDPAIPTLNVVHFGGVAAVVTSATATTLETTVPGGLVAGALSLTVKTRGGTASVPFTAENPVPVLTALSPSSIPAGSASFTLTLSGNHFLVASTVQFGGTALSPTFIDSGTLQVLVPASAVALPGNISVTVTNPVPGGGTSAALTLQIISSGPAIQSFSPTNGKPGTPVTISGLNFDSLPSNNQVTFNGKQALIASATATEIKTTVPLGASTGPIILSTPTGSDNGGVFTINLSADFTIAVSPFSVDVVPGGKAALRVSLLGAGEAPYAGLIGLSVNALPTGISSFFSPSIGQTGQASYLNLFTPSTLAPGAYPITVQAQAKIDGQTITHDATFTLNVLAAGTTTLSGQVLASETGDPLANVLVKNGGTAVTTDAAGNFFFSSIATGTQLLLIDGTPAGTANVSYPIDLPVQVEIAAGINNVLPYPVYLHEVNTKHFTLLDTSAGDVIVSDPDIPRFELRIPQGVQIIGWDGQPNTQMSVKSVPIDRLPLPPLPDNAPAFNVYMFHFFKPGGGTPTQPIPVKFPNDAGLEPGAVVDLYYYDEEPIADPTSHQWKTFGTGTVSPDARQIVSDPGVGIPKFCCGGATPTYVGQSLDNKETPDDPPSGGDPVDLSTGLFSLQKTDMMLPGLFPIRMVRSYTARSGLLQSVFPGPFGPGTSHGFNHRLRPHGNSTKALILLHGDDDRGLFSINPDGTFSNETAPSLGGAIVTGSVGGPLTLRYRDGRKWFFSNSGFLTRMEDRNGNGLDLIRDGSNRLLRIVQPGGRELRLDYDGSSGRISRLTDPIGRTVQYSYNVNGMLESVIDPEGGVTRYNYDDENRMTTITDARDILFLSNEYDANDRVTRQTNADGGVFEFQYFGPEGRALLDVPETLFIPLPRGCGGGGTVTLPPGSPPPTGARCVIWQFEVGPAEHLVSQTIVIDPEGNPTSYEFTSAGYTKSTTDAAGQTTRFERAIGTNQLLSTTDALDRLTTFTYDDFNNLLTSTDPDGNVTTFTYEPAFNQVATITDALGQVTSFTYDAQGNLLTTTDPSGAVTTITYTAKGQPKTVTDPLGNVTQFAYDAFGNLTAATDPIGNTTTRIYDPASRLLTVTDPRGETTGFVYDNLNRVTTITDPGSNTTQFSYDQNGNLLSVTDANNNTTTYSYDVQDRLGTRTDPLLRSESYLYDLNGNLTTFTDRKAQVTTFSYDPLNRRVRANYADGTQTGFVYDTAGRLDTIIEGPSTIQFDYDNLDRLLSELTPQGLVSYGYDVLGRRTSMSVNGTSPVLYQYDANSRLTQVAQGPQIVGLNYDLAGRRTSLIYPNGTSTSYAYDTASRLTNITHQAGTTPFESITYTYDAAGNRIGIDRTNGAAVLLPESVQAAYDAANEQIQFNSPTPNLNYDANGNLTSQTDASGTTTYTWDARNRLIGISGPNVTASFVYDALGRRTNKTVNGVQTDYQYDGNDIVAEISGGAVSAGYLRSLSIDEPFVRQLTTNEYYHVDALGSTLDLTDETGAVITNYEYTAFGKTTINGTSTNPFQYTGRENDGMGLLYYRARYYDVSLQRFISPDPSGSPIRPAMFIGGVPWVSSGSCTPLVISDPYRLQYIYVKDNPLNLTDPSGLAGTEACDYYDKQCEKKFPSKQRKDRNDSIFASQSYECKAGQCCRDFGEDSKQKNNIRGCLIKADFICSRIQDEVSRKSCRLNAHRLCYGLNLQPGRFQDEPSSCGGLL